MFYGELNTDRYIRETFYPDMKYKGIFVDVGAASPTHLSISKHFRDNGWKIISIEPLPEFCEMYKQLGYNILEYAVSNFETDDADFTVVTTTDPGLTLEMSSLQLPFSLDGNDKMTTHKIKVKVRKLDTILSLHHPELSKIDILKVDVEHHDLAVLEGFSFDKYKPDIIIIEDFDLSEDIHKYLKNHNYYKYHDIKYNKVYLRTGEIQKSLMEHSLNKEITKEYVMEILFKQIHQDGRFAPDNVYR